jgi:hypothetical protein
MTEYEIADLALSTQEGIREHVSLLQAQAGLMLTSLSVYFSLIFGYLLVAYFVGANLTRAQNVMLTVLYLLTMTLNRAAFLSIQLAGQELFIRFMDLEPDTKVIFLFTDAGIAISTAVFAATIVATLYFMWRVRHPKTE